MSEKITQLSSAWQGWIIENIARDCTAGSMIEQMVQNNFDPAFASMAVYQLKQNPQASMTTKSLPQAEGYVYETPRLPMDKNVIQTHDKMVRVAFRMAKPVVAVFDNLLSEAECDELVRLSRIKLKRSCVVDPITGQDAVIDARSSFGTFFTVNENAFITALDKRIAEVMHWPVENGEGLQILNYQIGGEYKPHFDYFPPADSGSKVHTAKGGQRVSTLIIYLNDVEAGGETILPEVNLAIVPKKGSACYFEYCNSQNQIDPMTLHGGAPVIAGEKWIATKWMRQERYGL